MPSRRRPDAAQAVLASSAFPHLTDADPWSGSASREEHLVDGACGMPLPILAGVKRFRPDTLIVLASLPSPQASAVVRAVAVADDGPHALRHMPVGLRKSAAAMSRAMAAEADRLERLKRIAGAASRRTAPRSPSSRGPPTC